jgi:hypothetical protein
VEVTVMTSPTNVSLFSSSRVASRAARASGARERWLFLRDLLGGALLLAVWLALWTVTWAAVAGPLSPSATTERAQAAVVERT